MNHIVAPTVDMISLAPVIVLSVFAMGVLILDLFIGKNKSILVYVSLVGLLMTLVSAFANSDLPSYSFRESYVVDNFSIFFIFIFTISSALAIMLSVNYNNQENIKIGEYYSLILFCTVGMIILASSTDLIMIFLGIEIVSICLYILAGIRRDNTQSNEAALKYFLLGAFATGFLLYGMALLYGATGTTKLAKIATVLSSDQVVSKPLLLTAMVLLVVGFGFKVASVPFHMWAPDVYQGAPTPITAFMAVGPKAAVFASFYRVFAHAMPQLAPSWTMVLSILAVLSMFFGNMGAIFQTNIKRLLAYSSVSHAGYILIALVANSTLGSSSLVFYLLTYLFTTFGAFAIIIILGRRGSENLDITDYSGLAYKHPILALCMTIFLLSLGGVPPTAGFMGKFYIFSAAIREDHLILVIIAVLNTVVSFYYYLKVIVQMYMKEPTGEFHPSISPLAIAVVIIAIIGTFQLGIFPGPFISFAQQ